jgi:uncharacterized membrane protein HdeD (DUF308 family)
MNRSTLFRKQVHAMNRWWMSILLGILFIITGIWVMTALLENYAALSVLFSIVLLANGSMEICCAVSLRNESNKPMLMGGIIDIATGVILLSTPLLNFLLLSIFIGFAPLFRAVMSIDPSFDLKENYDKKWGVLLLAGIASVILTIVLLFNPAIAGFAMFFCTGWAFIAIGAFRILLGFRLKAGSRGKK